MTQNKSSYCLKIRRIYPVSCRSWWKWMHSCVTKDGKKHLTTAQWHGFVMVFTVKECLSIVLEALLSLSPLSSAHLESRFLGFIPASETESVNGITSEEEVLTVVMISCDKLQRGFWLARDLSQPQIIFIIFHIASDLPTLADVAVDSLQPFIIFYFSSLMSGFLHNQKLFFLIFHLFVKLSHEMFSPAHFPKTSSGVSSWKSWAAECCTVTNNLFADWLFSSSLKSCCDVDKSLYPSWPLDGPSWSECSWQAPFFGQAVSYFCHIWVKQCECYFTAESSRSSAMFVSSCSLCSI